MLRHIKAMTKSFVGKITSITCGTSTILHIYIYILYTLHLRNISLGRLRGTEKHHNSCTTGYTKQPHCTSCVLNTSLRQRSHAHTLPRTAALDCGHGHLGVRATTAVQSTGVGTAVPVKAECSVWWFGRESGWVQKYLARMNIMFLFAYASFQLLCEHYMTNRCASQHLAYSAYVETNLLIPLIS